MRRKLRQHAFLITHSHAFHACQNAMHCRCWRRRSMCGGRYSTRRPVSGTTTS